jgi:serine/threonine protein kinase
MEYYNLKMTEYSRLDNYEILQTLGQGASAKVRLGRDINTNVLYAIKILKKTTVAVSERFTRLMENELNMLTQISHLNVVKVFHSKDCATYERKNGAESYPCMYIVMEYCSKGELFDVVYQTGQFTEAIARFYFG